MNNISSSNSRTSPCVTHPTTNGNLALWGYSSSSVLSKQILCHANTSYYLCSAIPPVPLAVPASQGRCSCAIFTIPTLVYPVLSKLQGLGTPPVPFALDIYTPINTLAVVHSFLRLLLAHERAKLSWKLHLCESELQQGPEMLPIPTSPPSVMCRDYHKKTAILLLLGWFTFLFYWLWKLRNKINVKCLGWEGFLQCRNHRCARWPHYKHRNPLKTISGAESITR